METYTCTWLHVHEESEWSLMTSLIRLFRCPFEHAVGMRFFWGYKSLFFLDTKDQSDFLGIQKSFGIQNDFFGIQKLFLTFSEVKGVSSIVYLFLTFWKVKGVSSVFYCS